MQIDQDVVQDCFLRKRAKPLAADGHGEHAIYPRLVARRVSVPSELDREDLGVADDLH